MKLEVADAYRGVTPSFAAAVTKLHATMRAANIRCEKCKVRAAMVVATARTNPRLVCRVCSDDIRLDATIDRQKLRRAQMRGRT